MHTISRGTDKGVGAVNEDIAGTHGHYAWIFDGATATGKAQIPGGSTDAAWLVRQFDSTIRRLAEAGAHDPLPDLVLRMIRDVRSGLKKLGLSPDRLTPYASGAIVRSTGRNFEYYLLGDVTLALHGSGQNEVVTDVRAGQVASLAVDLATRFSGEELRRKQRQFEREFVNRADGYWVLGTSADSVSHGIVGRTELDDSALVLLATDGFTRAVDDLGLAESWPNLIDRLALLGDPGVGTVIAELRQREVHPDYLDVPRIKQSDDATAILLRIGDDD